MSNSFYRAHNPHRRIINATRMKKIRSLLFLGLILAIVNTGVFLHACSAGNKVREDARRVTQYDITQFGSLTQALSSLGHSETVLIISNEQSLQGKNVIPSNIILKFKENGAINIPPQAELLIKGSISAGRIKVFSGAGKVNISSGIMKQVFPEWWGAKRDGKSDDTQPVQAAISSLVAQGGEVAFADGVYIVDSISLASGVSIVGVGRESVLEQKRYAQYCCSINPIDGGTPNPNDNKTKIRIENIHFRGRVVADGFSEHVHLLNINAATNVAISNCWFSGWRGDGIYIGSSNTAQTERHNKNIIIRNCVFDGVNNDNRNAISIIDCDGLEIDNNTFSRCTRPNMPGAIDIEPDANRFSVIRNIKITRNKFNNIGGGVGIIAVVLPLSQKKLINPSHNIMIRDNLIDGLVGTGRSHGINIMQSQDAGDSDISNEIALIGNEIKNTARPFVISGVKGVTITDNIFADSLYSGYVSRKTDHKSQDISFKRNSFKELGKSEGSGIIVFSSQNISFIDNIFEDNGSSTGRHGAAMDLSKWAVTSIQIYNNRFRGKRAIPAVLLSRDNKNHAELANHITQNNLFDAGIKPVFFQ